MVKTQRIIGCDITSAPRPKKPIMVAEGTLAAGRLHIDRLIPCRDFEAFDAWLASHRETGFFGAFDVPFGMPAQFIRDLGWPLDWANSIRRFSALTRVEFGQLISENIRHRPQGQRLYWRPTDRLAGSQSPMMWNYVPVARMFHAVMPRLAETGCDIRPCRPTDDPRRCVEGYPALVAQRIAKRYKTEKGPPEMEVTRSGRMAIITALVDPDFTGIYDVSVTLADGIAETLLEDRAGDAVDAVLCAMQAAWAAQRDDFGIPPGTEPCEGSIVDPLLLANGLSGSPATEASAKTNNPGVGSWLSFRQARREVSD